MDDQINHQDDTNSGGGVYYSSFSCIPVIVLVPVAVYLCMKHGYCKHRLYNRFDRSRSDITAGVTAYRNHEGYLEFEELPTLSVSRVPCQQPPSYDKVVTSGGFSTSQRDILILNPNNITENQRHQNTDRHSAIDMEEGSFAKQPDESLPGYEAAVRRLNEAAERTE